MSKTIPAVKAIIQQNNKFLVIKQKLSTHTYWDIPGWKVEFDENPYETLNREVMEEINIPIDIIKPVWMFWFFRNDWDQVICTTFLCEAKRNDMDLTKNPAIENITEYRWVTKEEFLSDEYRVDNESLKELIASSF